MSVGVRLRIAVIVLRIDSISSSKPGPMNLCGIIWGIRGIAHVVEHLSGSACGFAVPIVITTTPGAILRRAVCPSLVVV